MLHAIARGKAKAYLSRELRGESGRVPAEDMLVASVFGPLAFFRADVALRALDCALGLDLPQNVAGSQISFEFWPRWDGIEPDLVATATLADGTQFVLILEAKWSAPFSRDQMKLQWDEAISRYGNHRIFRHVALAKDRGAGREHLREADLPNDKDGSSAIHRARSWADIAHAVRGFGEAGAWSILVREALRRLGAGGFQGFLSPVAPTHFGYRQRAYAFGKFSRPVVALKYY